MSATTENLTDQGTASKLGLLPEEFERICSILGRTPNFTELSIFSVMWSEHCSYKNSIKWLKTLPREGDSLLAKAGEENAGLVDIGDGLACAFKIESHNHPSALEPYQGAATGVGGINRDIFTMGARPVAQLNSLRFGDIKLDRTRWLLRGVVKGIGDYGNAFGVPVVAGEVFFDEVYNENPLVNAMSAGIVKVGETASAISYGVDNPVYIVGSSTGKDGIHGATFASGDLTEESAKDLPAVQVGDPFQEKLLLEATLEVIQTGAIIGMQDMGAAGITCSTSEMSAKGEHGMEIWLDKVPTRQQGMHGWEILLSESQERMLMVVEKGREDEVEAVFSKWDLHYAVIGKVTGDGRLKYYMNGELEADVPADDLVLGGGAPVYDREFKEPSYYSEYKQFDIAQVPEPERLDEVGKFLLSDPNLASKKWVTRQYDSMVGTKNMSTNLPSDAAIVNIKESGKAIALTVDCNARYVHADPFTGACIAVNEAARNLICSGARPLAITNCLNFGNPYNPEVYWQFVQAIKGMGAGCSALGTPVTGGNVSFYNQTAKGKDVPVPVFPTPTIGMLGLLDDKHKVMGLGFRAAGDLIYLLGDSVNDIASSEYLVKWHKNKKSSAPYFNQEREKAVHELVMNLIGNDMILSAHDVSDGGLFTNLVESAMVNKLGFSIGTDEHIRRDAFLFGESQGRIVVSIDAPNQEQFVEYLALTEVPFSFLGMVIPEEIVVDEEPWGPLSSFVQEWQTGLSRYMDAH
ncbi:MAG: phosphoribosylformylglycinamidine synthase subunit PurL [Bacteroidia bacterium]